MVRKERQELLDSWPDVIANDPDAKPLKREQEAALWPLAKSGDEAAKLKLLKSQWRLVYKIAQRYEWTGCTLDDLIGWGMEGLLRAFNKFKPATGNKFSTVSMFWIRQCIGYEAPRMALSCSVPRAFYSKSYRDYGGISDELFNATTYNFSRQNNFPIVFAESGDECDTVTHMAVIDDRESTDETIDQRELREIVRNGSLALPYRVREVVRRRLHGQTLEQIAADYGVTKERIRQIEAQGRVRLRKWIEVHHPSIVEHFSP